MADQLNWGIIGSGGISNNFVKGMPHVPDANIYSVLSRSADGAAQFAQQFGADKQYTDMDAFLADSDLDVVYIGSPHSFHREQTIQCLNAGKHVLCEKPLALNTDDVRQMQTAAKANNRFLMEAMWMWFIPATIKAKELIDAGEIGEPQALMADMGFRIPADKTRFFDLAFGGGALLDMGIYPLAIALYLFGKPDALNGTAIVGPTGVDEQIAVAMTFGDGRLANVTTTIRANTPCSAVIMGSEGSLTINTQFWRSSKLSLTLRNRDDYDVDVDFEGNGYSHEIREVHACIHTGKLESDVMSWRASLDLMGMMDTLRAQWGIRFPHE